MPPALVKNVEARIAKDIPAIDLKVDEPASLAAPAAKRLLISSPDAAKMDAVVSIVLRWLGARGTRVTVEEIRAVLERAWSFVDADEPHRESLCPAASVVGRSRVPLSGLPGP